MKKSLLAFGAIGILMAVAGSNALADDAATIFTVPSGTAVTYDGGSGGYPVVTAVLSEPGTFNGKTYYSWSFLAEDASGSLDMYNSDPLPGSYIPTVGDAITGDGTYSPYNQIPEVGSLSSITVQSTGNAVPTIGTSTIATLNQTTLPQNIAGRLWTLNNVTISGISGTFDISNLSGMISDGVDSMTLYYWVTSYAAANQNLYGMTIPTGPVNITGFVSVYNSTSPEFVPISITSVPEPATLSLFGAAGLLALVLRRRR